MEFHTILMIIYLIPFSVDSANFPVDFCVRKIISKIVAVPWSFNYSIFEEQGPENL
jgi:hypothetical protein